MVIAQVCAEPTWDGEEEGSAASLSDSTACHRNLVPDQNVADLDGGVPQRAQWEMTLNIGVVSPAPDEIVNPCYHLSTLTLR
eukprot:766932-Hanusia_phi.AAC.7